MADIWKDGKKVEEVDFSGGTFDSSGRKLTPSGGGGGDVATDAIWDAKGDIAVATGADAAVRVAVGPNDYVLTADSAETSGVKWAAAPATGAPSDAAYYVTTANGSLSAEVVVPAYIQTLLDDTDAATARTTLGLGTVSTKKAQATTYKSGVYYTEPFITGNSIQALTLNLAVAIPWYTYGNDDVTFSSVNVCNVTTGAATSEIRFGVYDIGANVYPDALLYDLGTVDTSGTGVKTITSSFTLPPGWCYLVFALQGATGVSVRGNAPGFVRPNGVMNPTASSLTVSSGAYTIGKTGVTGAFPSSFGTPNSFGANTYPRFDLVAT